jgi:hypothetical protein
MFPGFDESMGLTDQFFPRILGNGAEHVVHIRDHAPAVGDGHNGGLVQGVPDVLKFLLGPFQGLSASGVVVHLFGAPKGRRDP